MKKERKIRLFYGSLAIFVLMLNAMPVLAQENGRRQESWHEGAGIAALIDRPESEEETDGEGQEAAAARESEKTPDEAGAEGKQNAAKDEKDAEPETEELVMAHVNNVLNVRREPDSEAELAGYLYADCGGTVLEQKDGWTKLESGELVGWAKDDYLLFGEEAKEAAENAGRTVATTTTGALRIRKAPSADAGVYDLLEEGAEYEVVNEAQLAFSDDITISSDWVAVDYEGKTGFVSAEYVKIEFLVDYGETVEQVQARQEEEKRQEEALKAEQQKKEVEKAKALAASDEMLLAALIQCEAGNQVYEGQVAVGAVVMNRVKSGAYPNTIKDVIFASGQFTPAGSGKLGSLISSGNIKASCIQAAREAIAGVSPIGTATHFRRAGSTEGIVIGNHVFW
ncbi:MAG: cell wall hydrolase [Eubacteriales bacterium]|nr:cell wall hydrolase [Eubacteriales bacterium]